MLGGLVPGIPVHDLAEWVFLGSALKCSAIRWESSRKKMKMQG